MPKIQIPRAKYPSKGWQKWYGCVLCGGQWTEDSDATGTTDEKQGFGRLYSEADTVVAEDGKRYCLGHFRAKYHIKYLNEAEVDINDDDRGDEIDFG
jgi:hypothetical protein